MHKSTAFPTLIDLTQRSVDDAGKNLHELHTERQHAQVQLDTLLDYRQDYTEKLQKIGLEGLTASNYHNFRQFIATLDHAIAQQNTVVELIDQKIVASRQRWTDDNLRLRSYQTLHSRQQSQVLREQHRKEQQVCDEMAASTYQRRRATH